MFKKTLDLKKPFIKINALYMFLFLFIQWSSVDNSFQNPYHLSVFYLVHTSIGS